MSVCTIKNEYQVIFWILALWWQGKHKWGRCVFSWPPRWVLLGSGERVERLTDENLKGKGSEVRICTWCWGEDTFLPSAWLGSDVMMDFSDSGALLYPLSPVWLLTHFLTRPLASVYSLCFESQLPTFEFLHLPSSPDSQRNSPIFHCLWYLNFFLVPFFRSDHQSYNLGSLYLVIYDALVSGLSVFCLFISKLDYILWSSWGWFRAVTFQKWVKYLFISCSKVVNFALLNKRVVLSSLMLHT